MAVAFGFDWLVVGVHKGVRSKACIHTSLSQAAGEAEAELARMNYLGFIDAVLTEDSDALMFGARVIIRR